MLPLSHIGYTVFLASLLYLPLRYAFIGALLPDLIDKSLFLAGLSPCGRFIAHSPFFMLLTTAAVYALTRRRDYTLGTLFGYFMHLVEDVKYLVLWLYPFVNYELVCPPTIAVEITFFDIFLETFAVLLLVGTLIFRPRLEFLKKRMKLHIPLVFCE